MLPEGIRLVFDHRSEPAMGSVACYDTRIADGESGVDESPATVERLFMGDLRRQAHCFPGSPELVEGRSSRGSNVPTQILEEWPDEILEFL